MKKGFFRAVTMIPSRLYINNIDTAATEPQLEFMFSKFGDVNIIKMNSKKGKALIEMSTPYEARNARDALNGTRLMGRAISVNTLPARLKGKLLSFLKKD